jgi:hypothetical protein
MSSADIAACFPSEHDSLLVLGLGMGGWASIKTMDEKVKEFELFDRCNGC